MNSQTKLNPMPVWLYSTYFSLTTGPDQKTIPFSASSLVLAVSAKKSQSSRTTADALADLKWDRCSSHASEFDIATAVIISMIALIFLHAVNLLFNSVISRVMNVAATAVVTVSRLSSVSKYAFRVVKWSILFIISWWKTSVLFRKPFTETHIVDISFSLPRIVNGERAIIFGKKRSKLQCSIFNGFADTHLRIAI